ncbi:hypothetical protein B0T10DRAFT_583522 [Thelonectria olida]|uniref:Uncharacterized protein n=1 Tax=Thelonectria olida TaxID=1576542 RepID=A0A9P9AV76_9HYPO|nr:hypothetical protein B0T10DRAFT_583522 [Thelonectria olida]
MPPFAAELEEWWLGPGSEALTSLVDPGGTAPKPQECGFAQDIRHRLCSFDNNRALQADLEAAWPAIRAARSINYSANPRKHLKEASRNIFLRAEDGAMNKSRVMDGLGYLDAMEAHRLHLMKATKRVIDHSTTSDQHLLAIKELHRQALVHYGHFHLGFRTCILIDDLAQAGDQKSQVPKIMARLNALFPPVALLEDEDDHDPTPYSAGLRGSIRFSVFQHLMSDQPSSDQRQQAIKMKLLGWCDIPGYDQARDSLIRYCEEVKKLEDICLAVLDASERQSTTPRRGSSLESSYISRKTSSTTPESSSISPSKTCPEITISTDPSSVSRHSSRIPPRRASAILASNPLLRGMPGREISAAKTDGALFAQDTNIAPVLSYPADLSKTEFYQHPLAQELDISPLEIDDECEPEEAPKDLLQVLVNDGLNKRKRRQVLKEDVPPVPPLPPIPEYFRANLTPKVLQKIVKRMRSRNDLKDTPKTEDPGAGKPRQPALTSGSLKFSSKKRRRQFKPQISCPEPIPEESSWNMHATCSSDDTTAITQPGHLRASYGPKLKYQLGKARLSPMEYVRLYLIEKSLSERENRQCELPKPEKKWFWTPRWEKFIIIPRIPACIRRDIGSLKTTDHKYPTILVQPEQDDSDTDSVVTVKPDKQDRGWKRLSLHLGDLPALLPNFMDASSFNSTEQTAESDAEASKPDTNKSYEEDRLAEGIPSSDDSTESQESRDRLDIHSESPMTGGSELSQKIRAATNNFDHDASIVADPEVARLDIEGKARGERRSVSPELRECPVTTGFERKAHEQALTTPNAPKTHNTETEKPLLSFLESSPSSRPSPLTARRGVTHSPQSETCTPLARFPISVQQSSRLTPSMLMKHVVGGAGGQVHPNDSQRPLLVQSSTAELPLASSADVWGSLSGDSRGSGIRPEPLRIGGRNSQQKEEGRSCRRKALGDLFPSQWREYKESERDILEMGKTNHHGDQHHSPLSGHKRAFAAPKRLGGDLQGIPNIPENIPSYPSTTITPTPSSTNLQAGSPFKIADEGPSGFTPRHPKGQAKSLTSRYLKLSDKNKLEASRTDAYANIATNVARGAHGMERLDEVPFEDHPHARQQQGSLLFDRSMPPTPPRQYNSQVRNHRTLPQRGTRDAGHYDAYEESIGPNGSKSPLQTERNLPTQLRTRSRLSAYLRQYSNGFGPLRDAPLRKPAGADVSHVSSQGLDTVDEVASSKPNSSDLSRTETTQTPSSEGTDLKTPQTPSSTIGSLFRKRNWSQYGGSTPRTPGTPSAYWRPFEEPTAEPPCTSSWMAGGGEDGGDKRERALYFKNRVGYPRSQNPVSPPGASMRKPSLSQMRSQEDIRSRLSRRQSTETLVKWRDFISDAPEPLFTSPPPPVPPLPATSRLESLRSVAESEVSGTETAEYKATSPDGFQVESQSPRKPSNEAPKRRVPKSTRSMSALRSAFKRDALKIGLGKTRIDEREDEVVPRQV